MSVLVKGMEMPKNGYDCPLCRNGLCRVADDNSDGICLIYGPGEEHRPSDCPLVEVPPHGRLIDADALMLMIQEYIDEYGWDVDEHGFHSEKWCAMKETEMAINDAPTVIHADEGGET